MAGARIEHEHGFHTHILERDVELLGLGARYVVVVQAVHEHDGRAHSGDVPEGRALPQPVHDVALMGEAAVLDGEVVVVVREVVEADQVRNAGARYGGGEPVRLRDQPVRELAAVAAAFDADPVAVEPGVAPQRGVGALQDVERFTPVLVGEDGVGESLAVSGRAAVIDHQRRPALCRERLRACVEARALLAVRATVDHDDERVRG